MTPAKTQTPGRAAPAHPHRSLVVGLARAFGGAILFSLPLLMTMEMWALGATMDRLRLALFLTLMLPVLVCLDYYCGFEETSGWTEDVVDGVIAYGVGFSASAVILLLLGVVDLTMPFREVLGLVAIQAIPASFGATLANGQFASVSEDAAESTRRTEGAGYGGELFFMATGATFLAFNVAPTEEMILIAFGMTPWHALGLLAFSLVVMHAFVYAVEFRGTHQAPEGTHWTSVFLRFTVVGYAIALLISAYVLWTFGRFEGIPVATAVMETVVLGFPAALGAATARLIL